MDQHFLLFFYGFYTQKLLFFSPLSTVTVEQLRLMKFSWDTSTTYGTHLKGILHFIYAVEVCNICNLCKPMVYALYFFFLMLGFTSLASPRSTPCILWQFMNKITRKFDIKQKMAHRSLGCRWLQVRSKLEHTPIHRYSTYWNAMCRTLDIHLRKKNLYVCLFLRCDFQLIFVASMPIFAQFFCPFCVRLHASYC